MANDIVAVWGDRLKIARQPANGELLIGDGANFKLSTLTAGGGVTITNASGGITISATGSGGTVTNVTGTAPITSTGGSTPAIGLTVPLDVQYGGTGLNTLTAGSLLVGNGTSDVNLVAPGASGNVLTSNGTAWASTAPAGTWTLIKKTANQIITSSAAYVDDTELQFPGVSGTTYIIRGVYLYNVGGGGARIAFNGPTQSLASILVNNNGGQQASGYNATAYPNGSTNGSNNFSAFYAVVTLTASGTISMRISQNTSSASSTTFTRGSWLEYTAI